MLFVKIVKYFNTKKQLDFGDVKKRETLACVYYTHKRIYMIALCYVKRSKSIFFLLLPIN